MRIVSVLVSAALVALPTAASAEFIRNFPTTNLSSGSPIVVTETSIFVPDTGNRDRLCVSFRDVSNKPASSARITFKVDDLLGQPVRESVLNRNGSFAPGVLIEGKMSVLGGNSDSYDNCVNITDPSVKASRLTVDVTSVTFMDGTTWTKGQSFVRAYDQGGNPVTQTVVNGTGGYIPGQGYQQPIYAQPYAPQSQSYVPQSQNYMPAPQTYVPQQQMYAPPSQTYVPQQQYGTSSRPYALVGFQVRNGNAVDWLDPIYAPIGPDLSLQNPVLGQGAGGAGGNIAVYQPAGYVLTGIDLYRGVYDGQEAALGMKLYWNRLTPGGDRRKSRRLAGLERDDQQIRADRTGESSARRSRDVHLERQHRARHACRRPHVRPRRFDRDLDAALALTRTPRRSRPRAADADCPTPCRRRTLRATERQ